MKKLFAAFAALFLTASASTASAQAIMNGDTFEDYRLGVQVGLNIPSFGEDQYGPTIGWNLGVTGIYNTESFVSNTYLRASALYSRKGASGDHVTYPFASENSYKFEDATYYLHYLEVPVRLGYAYELDDNFTVFGETGPYLAFRFSGSQRYDKATYKGNTLDLDKVPSSMKDTYEDLRRFDIGWGVHAGVLYQKRYQLSMGYDWGFCDVVPSETGRNLNLSLNLTVYFEDILHSFH